MCGLKMPKPRPALIPADTGQEAARNASIEAEMRRRRRGAAANILTSPTGIPASATLGGGA